jgi:hypothetical protein
MAMDHNSAVVVEDAHVQGARVQVDAAGPLVLPCVEAPEVSSSLASLPSASIPRRYAEEGASISINGLEPTRRSARLMAGAHLYTQVS